MATKLESKVVRETTIKVNDREIVITLTEEEGISLKLKGMKSGTVSIGIRDLWDQLNNDKYDDKRGQGFDPPEEDEEEEVPRSVKAKNIAKEYPGDTLVSLNKLRSLNAVTHSDLDVTVKIDELIVGLLKNKH